MKKMIYAVISLIMIVVFGGMSFAADNCCCEDENGSPYCLEGNPYNCYVTANGTGNCVWWAYYKRDDLAPFTIQDAGQWFNKAVVEGKLTGQTPAKRAIAVYSISTFGHVAYVESVNSDGSFQVSEMGYNAWDCVEQGNPNVNSKYLIGFIYGRAIKFSDSGTVYLYSNNQL